MWIFRTLKTWQIVVLVVLIAAIAGGGYGIYKSVVGPSTSTTATSNILYTQVSYGDISNSVTGSGNLEFAEEEELTLGSSKEVETVYVEEGDTVTKGQALACTDTESALRSVSKAQTSLSSAQIALHNCSDSSCIQQKGEAVLDAQYSLEDALEQLQSATLTAPFAGSIISVDMLAGDEGGSIVIVDTSSMELSAIVSEYDISQVEVGQQATVSVDAFSDIELTGIVTSVSLLSQASSGVVSYPVTIQLTNIPSGVQLRSGMSATATIITEEATNVLILPNKAITGASTDNPTVTVAADDGTSTTRAVTLGLVGDSYTEIKSGLNYGDTVSYTASTTSSSSSSSSSGSSGGFPGGGMMPGGGMFP